MKVSGFSYIRNGFSYDYPFIESICSALAVCDEFIIAVGNSTDGTREAIEAIGSEKIRIIDTVWDENLREGGKMFAMQANIGLDAIDGDWGFHIQADELIHEDEAQIIRAEMEKYLHDKAVEGIVFDFYHFYGGYDLIGTTRRWHRREVRVVRNNPLIRSYRDSQGFRIYPSVEKYQSGHKGRSLRVAKSRAHIYHYSYARNPISMRKKDSYFHTFWHDDNWLKQNLSKQKEYDYHNIDDLSLFTGTHPEWMKTRISKKDWTFTFDRSRAKFSSAKYRFLYFIEKATGWRIGEYRNYRIIRSSI